MATTPATSAGGSMIDAIAARHDELVALCRRFEVRRLDVFGSAVTDEFDPARSDVDVLVEIDPPAELGYFRAFFGFEEALEQLLGRPVDLVSPSTLETPYFAASVERTRPELFAASPSDASVYARRAAQRAGHVRSPSSGAERSSGSPRLGLGVSKGGGLSIATTRVGMRWRMHSACRSWPLSPPPGQ